MRGYVVEKKYSYIQRITIFFMYYGRYVDKNFL